MNSEPAQVFDTRTHIVDPKTGQCLKQQHYVKTMKKDGTEFFVRGNVKYCADGTRWDEVHGAGLAQAKAEAKAAEKKAKEAQEVVKAAEAKEAAATQESDPPVEDPPAPESAPAEPKEKPKEEEPPKEPKQPAEPPPDVEAAVNDI